MTSERGTAIEGAKGLLSVVVPVFNGEAHVARALRSVLAQADDALEIVVVDDGSTDRTAAILASFQDPRVRLLRQANQGVSAARNRGVEEARGDWVALIDADDEWRPGHVGFFRRARALQPEAILLSSGYCFQRGEARWDARVAIPPHKGPVARLTDYFDTAAQGSPPVCSSSAFACRAALRAVGGFPAGVRSGEDLLTWARLAMRGPVAVGHEVTAVFHLQDRQAGGGSLRRLPSDLERVGVELRRLLVDADPAASRGVRRYLRQFHLGAASQWVRVPDRAQAFRELSRAARLGAWRPKLFALALMAALPASLVRAVYARRRAS